MRDFRILRSFAVFAAQDDMCATSVFLRQVSKPPHSEAECQSLS